MRERETQQTTQQQITHSITPFNHTVKYSGPTPSDTPFNKPKSFDWLHVMVRNSNPHNQPASWFLVRSDGPLIPSTRRNGPNQDKQSFILEQSVNQSGNHSQKSDLPPMQTYTQVWWLGTHILEREISYIKNFINNCFSHFKAICAQVGYLNLSSREKYGICPYKPLSKIHNSNFYYATKKSS